MGRDVGEGWLRERNNCYWRQLPRTEKQLPVGNNNAAAGPRAGLLRPLAPKTMFDVDKIHSTLVCIVPRTYPSTSSVGFSTTRNS